MRLIPDFDWPTCPEHDEPVNVENNGDGCEEGHQFTVSCGVPWCERQAVADDPLTALRKFADGDEEET